MRNLTATLCLALAILTGCLGSNAYEIHGRSFGGNSETQGEKILREFFFQSQKRWSDLIIQLLLTMKIIDFAKKTLVSKKQNQPKQVAKKLNPRSRHHPNQAPQVQVSLSPNSVTSSPMNTFFVSAVQ